MSTYLDNSLRRKGVIVSLKPDIPICCSSQDSIRDVANLMARESLHCVLVKDYSQTDTSVIKGLITTKDIGLRVVGKGLDSNITKAEDIMTHKPIILYMDTSITEALSVMVNKNIRHLPLKDYNENILGVIDITKCFYQAMIRLERVAVNAKKLTSLLKDVESDFKEQHTKDAEKIIKDVEKLQELIQIPTLSKIFKFGKHSPVIYISSTSSVYEAAKLMTKNSITALLVKDGTKGNEKIIGIFTSKDICSRVISKGYDPRTCTVAKVLTPKPEFATTENNIASALKLMYTGNFLNLPVINQEDSSEEIVGVVNVLQLIYEMLAELGRHDQFDKSSYDKKTLDEINIRTQSSSSMFTPVWDRFWSSLEKSTEDIQIFESTIIKSPNQSRSQTPHQSRSTSASLQFNNSRKAALNQMILSNSNSRKSSFTIRRQSDGNYSETDSQSTNTLKPSNFKRIVSQESLVRTRYYIDRKTLLFKIRINGSSRVHKISMILNEGVEETDDLQLLNLLKLEIFSKLSLLLVPNNNQKENLYDATVQNLNEEYDFFYFDPEHNLVPLETELDLIKSIQQSDFEDSNNVEIMIMSKSNGEDEGNFGIIGSFFGGIWYCFTDVVGKINCVINDFIFNPNSSFITFTFTSLGLIMGFSLIIGVKTKLD